MMFFGLGALGATAIIASIKGSRDAQYILEGLFWLAIAVCGAIRRGREK